MLGMISMQGLNNFHNEALSEVSEEICVVQTLPCSASQLPYKLVCELRFHQSESQRNAQLLEWHEQDHSCSYLYQITIHPDKVHIIRTFKLFTLNCHNNKAWKEHFMVLFYCSTNTKREVTQLTRTTFTLNKI